MAEERGWGWWPIKGGVAEKRGWDGLDEERGWVGLLKREGAVGG